MEMNKCRFGFLWIKQKKNQGFGWSVDLNTSKQINDGFGWIVDLKLYLDV